MSWTVRMTMKMRDVVDGDLLRQAVESTRLRYPYYQVKLGMRKDAEGTEYFVYEDNSEPWVVSEGEKPVRLIGPLLLLGQLHRYRFLPLPDRWHRSL